MATEQAANPMLQFVPLILIMGIFYLLVIKPEKNKQKERKEKIAKIQKNDAIVTAGGIHGTVVNVKEHTVIVRVDDSVKMEFDKEAISVVKEK